MIPVRRCPNTNEWVGDCGCPRCEPEPVVTEEEPDEENDILCHICGEDVLDCQINYTDQQHGVLEGLWTATWSSEVIEGYLQGRLH